MESKKIKKLLDSYFEGKTSISQERILRLYFTSTQDLPLKWEPHRVFFGYYNKVSLEAFPVQYSKHKSLIRPWMIAAAMVTLIISIQFATKINNKDKGPEVSQEEMEFAFHQFKESMKKLSINLNKGTQKIAYLDYLDQTTQKIIK
jgi:hypothetical protein